MSTEHDVVCFYADLGRPYLPLIERMTKSAKAVMPDCKTVLITLSPTAQLCDLFDHSIHMMAEPSAATLCYDKARAILTYQASMQDRCVFVDPDLEFKKPIVFPENTDVALVWRKKHAQPVNGGMIFASPGSPVFWKKYGSVVASLPSPLRSWWADQLALSLMVGSLHEAGDELQAWDARVKLLAEADVCAPPEQAHEGTVALHYKGTRKGEGWDKYFGGVQKKEEIAA